MNHSTIFVAFLYVSAVWSLVFWIPILNVLANAWHGFYCVCYGQMKYNKISNIKKSSVQFSRLVISNSLQTHVLQHARLPCPSPTPGAYSNSCPLSQWCHPTISSSVIPCSSCLQSFPASRSFQMSQLFASGGQSIGVSASASVLPMNIQDWFPLGWMVGSPCCPRDSQESSPTPQFKSINSLVLSFLDSLTLTSIHDYWKNHSFD